MNNPPPTPGLSFDEALSELLRAYGECHEGREPQSAVDEARAAVVAEWSRCDEERLQHITDKSVLSQELATVQAVLDACRTNKEALRAELAAERQRAEGLRETLQSIAENATLDESPEQGDNGASVEETYDDMIRVARAALEPKL